MSLGTTGVADEILAKVKQHIGREIFTKIRRVSEGETVVFDWALDGIEMQWLYEIGRQKRLDRPDREKIAIQILKSLKKAMGFGNYKTGHWKAMTDRERQVYLEMADQILTLILDVEEAKREERQRIATIASFSLSS